MNERFTILLFAFSFLAFSKLSQASSGAGSVKRPPMGGCSDHPIEYKEIVWENVERLTSTNQPFAIDELQTLLSWDGKDLTVTFTCEGQASNEFKVDLTLGFDDTIQNLRFNYVNYFYSNKN